MITVLKEVSEMIDDEFPSLPSRRPSLQSEWGESVLSALKDFVGQTVKEQLLLQEKIASAGTGLNEGVVETSPDPQLQDGGSESMAQEKESKRNMTTRPSRPSRFGHRCL